MCATTELLAADAQDMGVLLSTKLCGVLVVYTTTTMLTDYYIVHEGAAQGNTCNRQCRETHEGRMQGRRALTILCV